MGAIGAPERWAVLGDGLWSLLDDAVGAFALLDAGGRIVDWNTAGQATFGWTREQAVGAEAVELLIVADLRAEFRAAFARVAADEGAGFGRQRVELRAIHRSGREVPIELVLSV